MTAPAPAGVLYGLIADATVWPLFFPPCVHVEQLDFDGTRERLRMWALAGDRISSWVSRRRLDVGQRRVEFRQELTSAPVESMTGVWTVRPFGDVSRVTLEHAFTVAGDAPADVAWVERVTRANSRTQLDRLAWLAERWTRLDDLTVTFEDTVRVKAPAELILDFLHRTADWPEDLADTRPLTVLEDTPGVQVLTLDGRSATGTEAVRISFPGAGRIVHKHTRTSGPLAAYTGEWSVEPDESGVNVTVRHNVLLGDDAVGPGESAARRACDELGRAGRRVLDHAARHASGVVRVL
ncbi:aromatase/cyclase [Streptomyces lancefieldiae]|uniref:SRPBCC family protein n=1 Tax=Streptomyces lancefieldiae TaxID=3075520 RepID=A0ABU3ASA1_9ACTN|nr:SRPBCC family protein [Streptomyces sp. DSM 40712]MDT0612735.1 SRPBCC family protein [Streptomyces sp. DSM 40712]